MLRCKLRVLVYYNYNEPLNMIKRALQKKVY